MSLPIVIIHVGCQEYLYDTIKNAKRFTEQVFLLGDDSNSQLDVNHVHLNTLRSNDLSDFEKYFVNYSTNSSQLEFLCFARMFYLKEWMLKNKIDKCIHIDSDCLLLDITYLKELAYIYPRLEYDDPGKMAGNISTSCLTIDFLNNFVTLCKDIYQNKSKFHLIEPKIQYHKVHNKPGGVCDMTLYYLLSKELHVHNLLDLQEDGSTFDDNINDTWGYAGYDTFKKSINGVKELYLNNNIFYAKTKNEEYVKINNLHCQGNNGKPLIRYFVNYLLKH